MTAEEQAAQDTLTRLGVTQENLRLAANQIANLKHALELALRFVLVEEVREHIRAVSRGGG